jgi:hypothetical protein
MVDNRGWTTNLPSWGNGFVSILSDVRATRDMWGSLRYLCHQFKTNSQKMQLKEKLLSIIVNDWFKCYSILFLRHIIPGYGGIEGDVYFHCIVKYEILFQNPNSPQYNINILTNVSFNALKNCSLISPVRPLDMEI